MSEWQVDPKKLLETLQVLDLVPLRPGIGSSSFVQLSEKDGLASMQLSSDVSGKVKVRGEGTIGLKKKIYLDRRLFFPFVFTAKTYRSEKPFVFSISEGKEILVQQGRRKARFDNGIPAAGYGEYDAEARSVVMPIDEKVAELISIACACSTPDPTVPELNCVYTSQNGKGLDLYASNQLVVFHAEKKSKSKFPSRLAFPLFLVPFLGNNRLLEVRTREKEVVLKFDCGYLWQGLSVKASKSFPVKTIEGLIAEGEKWPEVFRLQAHGLGQVTTRFSDYLTSVRRQDWQLFLKGTSGKKEIMLEVTIPQGTFREKVMLEQPLQQDVQIDWPLQILLPVLTYLAKKKDSVMSVRFGKKTPYLLTAGSIKVVVTRRKA